MTSSTFVHVDLDLIRLSEPLDFNLYQSTPQTGRVLIVPKGRAVDQNLKMKLTRLRAEVFILRQERERYRAHLEESLRRLLKDERIDETKAASLAYDLSLQAAEAVFQNPDPETLRQAEQSFETTAELILTKERALFALLELTRNSLELHVHSCNVAVFGLGLAKGLMEEGVEIDLRRLSSALFFHDLGQISLDPLLVGKTEGLSPEEQEIVGRHPALGRDLLREAGFLTPEAEAVVYGHHERLDGSGYPEGLRGEEIPLLARVCAVADVYDLLTSDRDSQPHQDGSSAAVYMVRGMPGKFDPLLLRKFIEMFGRR